MLHIVDAASPFSKASNKYFEMLMVLNGQHELFLYSNKVSVTKSILIKDCKNFSIYHLKNQLYNI